jgi:uncharacterized protein YjbI with pentapeptide repeats
MSKTITLSDEQYAQVKQVLDQTEEKKEVKSKTIIYKIDGNVLYESVKETIKEVVVEAVAGEADLRGADLRGANLRGAELCNTKFYGRGGTVKLKKDQVTDFLNALGFQVE